MGVIKNLARRWADPKLVEEADELRFRLVTTEASVARLETELEQAEANNDRLIAASDVWEKAYDELAGERDSALAQVALKAAEIVRLADENRRLNADLGDARDDTRAAVKARKAEQERNAVLVVDNGQLRLQLEGLERQAERDRARIEELKAGLADETVTPEVLSSTMRQLEIPEQRDSEGWLCE